MVRVLIALALASSVLEGRAGASVEERWEFRETPLGPRGARAHEMEEARERGRLVERLASLRGDSPDNAPLTGDVLRDLLDKAQEVSGDEPAWYARVRFPFSESTDRRTRLVAARAGLLRARDLVTTSVEVARRHLDALELEEAASPSRRALVTRLQVAQVELETRAREVQALLQEAAEDLELRTGDTLDRMRHCYRVLVGDDAATKLKALRTLLWGWGATRSPPVLGAELTYVQGALQSPKLPTTSITPAYLSADTAPSTLEDTTLDREVELSPAIQAKAAELRTAKGAYDFVKNQIRLDWYFGSLKGSTETLREARGNDADLATLLVALLRAQGTSARYVQGTVEVPLPRLAALMGLLSAADVDSAVTGSPSLADGVRNAALNALSATGVPYEPVVTGGQAVAVRFVHTWVEAWIAYGNYRGEGAGVGARQWVPMDPSFPGGARSAARPPAFDAFERFGFSAASLTAAYLGTTSDVSPVAFVRQQIEAQLQATNTPNSYGDLLRTVAQRAEELPFLPGSLPYRVVSVHQEMAFLPDEYKHRVRFVASDGTTTILDATLPLHQLVGHRTIFTYKPASDADAEAIAAAGGPYQAVASAVEVVPVVRVDGQERAAATRGVGLGQAHAWSMELLLPDGSRRRIDNQIIAGNMVAVGFGGPASGYVEGEPGNGDLDGPAPRFLYGRAAAYATAWTQGEEELGQLLQVIPVRPTASVVLVQSQLAVEQALGVRRRVVWKGLEIDADHRSMTPLELVPGRGKELMRLSGYQGSYLEAKVLADGAGVRSVSAVSVIQQANATGVPVLRLTPENAAAQLVQLISTPDVLQNVRDQLAQGREVLVPAADLTIENWTGTGFVARAPDTEEGGYFLSGVISGGQTVASPEAWQDAALAQALQQPQAPASTDDVTRIMAPGGDLQETVVGTAFPKPLAVYVTTATGVPVRGAQVTFRAAGVAKPKFHPVTETVFLDGPVVVRTDGSGRAAIVARPDDSTTVWSVVRAGVPNEQLFGYNEITASVQDAAGNTVVLTRPFAEIGKPDEPATLMLSGPAAFSAPYGLLASDDLVATVTDRFGNPVANRVVAWTQAPVTSRFMDPANRPADRDPVLDPGDPVQYTALQQITSSSGRVVMNLLAGGSTTVTATCGPASASYSVATDERGPNDHVFAQVAVGREGMDGIFAMSFPEPLVFQILRRGGSGQAAWTPVRGDEPDYQRVAVSMTVLDRGNPVASQSAGPLEVHGADSIPGLDTPTNVVFWPRYLLFDRPQQVRFDADVVRADGTRDCCSQGYTMTVQSSTVQVATGRVLPGRVYQTSDYGFSDPTDVAIAFTVPNAASYPIYAKIAQKPAVAGERLVYTPPPEQLQTIGIVDGLIPVKEWRSQRMTFDRIPGSHGGIVTVEVYAPDPQLGPYVRYVTSADIHVRAAPTGIVAPDVINPKVLIAIKNSESTENAVEGVSPPTATAEPIPEPALLEFAVQGAGRLRVRVGDTVLSAADFHYDADGRIVLTPVRNLST